MQNELIQKEISQIASKNSLSKSKQMETNEEKKENTDTIGTRLEIFSSEK